MDSKEIKVGQFGKGYNHDFEKWVIGKITSKEDNCIVLKDTYYLVVNGYKQKIKTADKLEDLIEIGDIVHYSRETFNGTTRWDIKDEDELEYIVEEIKNDEIKITAIELHENRQIQKLECDL